MMSPGHSSPAMFSPPSTAMARQTPSRSGSMDMGSSAHIMANGGHSHHGSPAIPARATLGSMPGSRLGSVEADSPVNGLRLQQQVQQPPSQQQLFQQPQGQPSDDANRSPFNSTGNMASTPGNSSSAGTPMLSGIGSSEMASGASNSIENQSQSSQNQNQNQNQNHDDHSKDIPSLTGGASLDDNDLMGMGIIGGLEMDMDMGMGLDTSDDMMHHGYGASSNDRERSMYDTEDKDMSSGLGGLEMEGMMGENEDDDVMNGFLNL
ncbi:hypothetical protein BGZ82_006987 [Podila clonocystis]|nr:hypothetical protein BGZ82_006987 [Podila clonocystis]